MRDPFRLIDGGFAEGRRQIAHDAALMELHAAGRLPNTVRFLRAPATVIIGRHQVSGCEADIARCRAQGVALARRLTGGGTIYVDERQLGWEIAFDRDRIPGPLDAVARALCEALAAGLSDAFGISARYRARNDIEVEGRRLGVAAGCFQGDTVFYQGVLNVDLDAGAILPCLNLPGRSGPDDCCAAAERMTSLRALLGAAPDLAAVQAAALSGLAERLGIVPQPAEPGPEELALAERRFREEIGTDAFVFDGGETAAAALRAARCGPVQVELRLEGARIREALFTGDFSAAPSRLVYDLEARLRDVPVTQAPAITEAFLSGARAMVALPVAQFREALEAALAPELAR